MVLIYLALTYLRIYFHLDFSYFFDTLFFIQNLIPYGFFLSNSDISPLFAIVSF